MIWVMTARAIVWFVATACLAPAASASSFTVNPTQIFLTAKATSALLTLRNESGESLRFQLTAFAWDQSPQGEMKLAPTEDIVFFPALLVLAPKESRNVRVGIAAPFGAAERTYRIFVEELPPLNASDSPAVRVLTKLGVPIFLQPSKLQSLGSLTNLGVKDGAFSFELRNSGNVHFLPQIVRVRGIGRTGETLLDKSMDGWYILAGGTRAYELKLPGSECGALAAMTVEVQIGAVTLQDRLQISAEACAR